MLVPAHHAVCQLTKPPPLRLALLPAQSRRSLLPRRLEWPPLHLDYCGEIV